MPEPLFPSLFEGGGDVPIRARRGGRLLEKSAGEMFSALSRFNEVPGDSFFSRTDVRIKALGICAAVVFTAFAGNSLQLLLAFCFSLPLYLFAGGAFKNVIPFVATALIFFIFIAAPASTNIVTPGDLILPLFETGGIDLGFIVIPPSIGVTAEGVTAVSRLFLRGFSTLLMVLLLSFTSSVPSLISEMPLPAPMRLILTIMHMNVRKMLGFSAGSHLARISRSPAVLGPGYHRSYIGLFLARLFRDSMRTSDEIHSAMLSRGWNRYLPGPERMSFGWREAAFLSATVLFCAAMGVLRG